MSLSVWVTVRKLLNLVHIAWVDFFHLRHGLILLGFARRLPVRVIGTP